jgi:hypothetical protein
MHRKPFSGAYTRTRIKALSALHAFDGYGDARGDKGGLRARLSNPSYE